MSVGTFQEVKMMAPAELWWYISTLSLKFFYLQQVTNFLDTEERLLAVFLRILSCLQRKWWNCSLQDAISICFLFTVLSRMLILEVSFVRGIYTLAYIVSPLSYEGTVQHSTCCSKAQAHLLGRTYSDDQICWWVQTWFWCSNKIKNSFSNMTVHQCTKQGP